MTPHSLTDLIERPRRCLIRCEWCSALDIECVALKARARTPDEKDQTNG